MGIRNAARRHGGIGLLLLTLIMVGIGCRAQEPEFLKHATRVVGIASPEPPIMPLKYWWLNPTQLLVTRRLEHGDSDGILFRYDIPTQRSTCLAALMQLLDVPRFDTNASSRYETIRVSPDGEWVLMMDYRSVIVYAARLDGSAVFHCVPGINQPGYSLTEIQWTNDSRHWVAFAPDWDRSPKAMVYDVVKPDKPIMLPTASSIRHSRQSKGRRRQWNAPDFRGMDSTHSLVVNDRILTCNPYGSNANTVFVEIVETGINLPAQSLQTDYVSLPPGCVLQEMQIAPSGEKIAWICTQKPWPATPKPWPAEDMFQSGYSRQGLNTMSVWVSKIDGSQMHRLASVTGNHWDDWALDGLQWVPGEQCVSFNCHGALRTLPVSIEDIAVTPR